MKSERSRVYGPYQPIVEAGDLFFVSGQVGIDPKTKHAPVSIEGQTQQLFKNLKEVLGAESLTLHNITKTTVFLKNMDDFEAMNEIYTNNFGESKPARSCVEVAGLPKVAENRVELLVEIEAIACKKGKK